MIHFAHSVLKKMRDLQKWRDMIRKLIVSWPQTPVFKEMMISLLRHNSFFTICKKALHSFATIQQKSLAVLAVRFSRFSSGCYWVLYKKRHVSGWLFLVQQKKSTPKIEIPRNPQRFCHHESDGPFVVLFCSIRFFHRFIRRNFQANVGNIFIWTIYTL